MVAVALGIVGIFLIAGLSIFRLFVDPGSSALEPPDGFAHFIKAVWPSSSSNCGKNQPLKDCAQPRANPDDATVDEDASVVIDVLANDRGLRDGGIEVEVTTSPLHGQYSITSGNAIAYTPVANFNGSDSLVYRVTDVNGDSSSAEVSITIAPVNDPPTVRKDVAYTYFEKSVQIDALANDSTAPDEGESLTIAELGMPEYGSVTVDSAGLIAYDPGTSYGTFDKFTYVVSDGNGATASAEVVVVRNFFYGTAVIEGRVTDESGAPIYGVWVNSYGLTGTTGGHGWTDIDGYYRMPNLRTGDYWVHFNPPEGSNYIRESYNNIRCCGRDPDPIHVVNGQTTSGIDAVLDEGGIISGRVTDSSGNPIEGITVYGSETDADGRYEIKGLATGDYRISFSSTPNGEGPSPAVGNYLSEVYNDKRKWDEGDLVHVEEGGRVDGIDASLAPGGRILGRVVDEAGNPISNLKVHASLDPWGGEGVAITDANGNYAIEALQTGSHRVFFNAFRTVYVSEWYDDTYSHQEARLVGVVEGADIVGIDAVVARGGTISGVITDESGSPLPGASVGVQRTDGSLFPIFDPYTTTDEAGRYSIKGLRSGGYHVSFSTASHLSEWYNDKASQETADVVEVIGHSDVTGIDASLAPAASISGRIYDEAGQPLTGARVEVFDLDQRWITGATADGAGFYTAGGLSPRTYKLKFNAPYGENFLSEWYADKASFAEADPISIVSTGQEITGIDAVLRSGASISGLITDTEGTPLKFVTVWLKNSNGTTAASTSTNSLGQYQILGLPAGSYRIRFGDSSGEYLPEWYENQPSEIGAKIVSLADGQHLIIDATLEKAGSISGRLTDKFGNPIGGGFVYATQDGAFKSYGAVSQTNGVFSVTGLPSGAYKVRFSATGYDEEWFNDKPDFAQADPITVTEGQQVTGIEAALELTNRSPVAVEDYSSTDEDTPVIIDLVANDTDADGDLLSIASASSGGLGWVEVIDAHRVSYTPCENCNGTDEFVYRVTDGRGGYSALTTVFVEVRPVNDAPVAQDDSFEIDEDMSIGLNPRWNDSDVDGDILFLESMTSPAHGIAVLQEDGFIEYTPEPNYYGSDAFTYEISDGAGGRASANIEIVINPVQDAPVAAEDHASTNEDSWVVIDLVANDSDVDGDPLTIVSAGDATLGRVEVIDPNQVRYTPCEDCNGSDKFTYKITDGQGGYSEPTAVFVEVFPVNDLPVSFEDHASTDEDSSVVIDLVANDSDVDGDLLSIVSAGGASLGGVEVIDGHRVTYTPCPDCNGSDRFTYQVTDSRGGYSEPTSVFVDIRSIGDAPVARDDSLDAQEDTAVTFDPRANDSDVDGDPLSVVSVTSPSHGTAVLNDDGTITYAPAPNYYGSDIFTYEITDGVGGRASASVEVGISPVQDAPVAIEDSGSTDEDSSVIIDVVANDSDVDGDPLAIDTVTTPSHGTAVSNGDGTITYTPEPNYHGSDAFSYEITDGAGGRASASVEVVINPIQDPPVARDDFAETIWPAPITIDVLANDEFFDGLASVEIVTQPQFGRAIVNPDFTITYAPLIFLPSESFIYAIVDIEGDRAEATVTVSMHLLSPLPGPQ